MIDGEKYMKEDHVQEEELMTSKLTDQGRRAGIRVANKEFLHDSAEVQ